MTKIRESFPLNEFIKIREFIFYLNISYMTSFLKHLLLSLVVFCEALNTKVYLSHLCCTCQVCTCHICALYFWSYFVLLLFTLVYVYCSKLYIFFIKNPYAFHTNTNPCTHSAEVVVSLGGGLLAAVSCTGKPS